MARGTSSCFTTGGGEAAMWLMVHALEKRTQSCAPALVDKRMGATSGYRTTTWLSCMIIDAEKRTHLETFRQKFLS
jgi:hypothetical protein